MRIAVLANDATNLYNHRFELVSALTRAGHQVEIIAQKQPRYEEFLKLGCTFVPIVVKRHQKNPLNDLFLCHTYYKLLKEFYPDAVLTYNIKPNVYGGFASRWLGINRLPNITGLGTAVGYPGILQKITLLLYRLALKKADTIFFQNEDNLAFFKKHHLFSGRTVPIILPGSGVNLHRYTPQPYPQGEVRFLFVARILKQKGIDLFLSAARKFHTPNITFHVCGPFDSNNYQVKLQQAVQKGWITYHGQQKDMEPFFKECSCLLHPSWYPEGMSNVLLEAAATARPAITTNHCGCREIVENGVTGFVVPMQDEKAFLAAVEKFLALPVEKRAEMGRKARAKVEKEFDRNLVAQAYLNRLEKLQHG